MGGMPTAWFQIKGGRDPIADIGQAILIQAVRDGCCKTEIKAIMRGYGITPRLYEMAARVKWREGRRVRRLSPAMIAKNSTSLEAAVALAAILTF